MDTSRDWAHELVSSLIWLSWVFPLTFVVSAVMMGVLDRITAKSHGRHDHEGEA